jgi:CheY-like chemotaxis protein
METKPTVLVIDDEPRVRATAVEMFERLGFAVLDTYSGEQALSILARHPEIVLVFVDVRMPGMDGVQLAGHARRLRPEALVVLTSGYVAQAPVDGFPFIRKPWQLSELAAFLPPKVAPPS